jgi:energy-coupling factor transport system ATP-binding protein
MEKGKIAFSGSPEEVFSKGGELRGMGLGLPEVAEMMEMMRAGGAAMEGAPLTVDAAEIAIDRYLRSKRSGF